MRLILRCLPVALAAALLIPGTGLAEDSQTAALWSDYVQAEEGLTTQPDGCPIGCELGCSGCDRGCRDSYGLLDDTYYFFAGDGWACQPDDDDANNFGFRLGFNSGIPLLSEHRLGMQIGTSLGLYDLHGREDGDGRAIEDQIMLTVGLFSRSDVCAGKRISWGVVYDHQFHNDFAEDGADYISLGQFRARLGYALDQRNEIGCWLTQTTGDKDPIQLSNSGPPPALPTVALAEPINQYNFFWQHHWQYGGDTMMYLGAVEDPGEFVVGLNGQVPLSRRCSFFGNFHYIKPSADAGNPNFEEEIWNVSCGLVFFPCSGARTRSVSGNRWLPLLPVADNGSFGLDEDPQR